MTHSFRTPRTFLTHTLDHICNTIGDRIGQRVGEYLHNDHHKDINSDHTTYITATICNKVLAFGVQKSDTGQPQLVTWNMENENPRTDEGWVVAHIENGSVIVDDGLEYIFES